MPEKYSAIYKYIRLDEYYQKIFDNIELYFSFPKDLNDPFDCQIDIKKILGRAINSPSLEIPDYQDHIEAIKKDLMDDEGMKAAEKIYNDQIICCFSLDPLNTLLWSHYADKCQGICLEFSWEELNQSFKSVVANINSENVKYVNEIPSIQIINNFFYRDLETVGGIFDKGLFYKLFAYNCFSYKSNAWCYEYEIRFIHRINEGEQNSIRFTPNALKSVIMGCKVDPGKEQVLLDKLKLPIWSNVRMKKLIKEDSSSFTYKIIDMD